jgi:Nif-specific regulatory protein
MEMVHMFESPLKYRPANSETARHTRELLTLYRVSSVLGSNKPQEHLLTEVLEILNVELNLRNGVIALLSLGGDELAVEVVRDLSTKNQSTIRYRMGEGITGRVIQTGQGVIVPKVSEEPLFLNRFERRQLPTEEISFICVPIAYGQEVIGTISVDHPFEESTSLEEDMRVLSIVASMIANDVRIRREARIKQQILAKENLRLRSELEDRYRPESIIGDSDEMRTVYTSIQQVSQSNTTVLIRGESGTGKELVAHAIHSLSRRSKGPFVRVNCAALNENLLDSELFGHEKGSFTGAVRERDGRIREAENGTLFLDEIGDFSPLLQVKLLRVLQEHEYQRVGSNMTATTNARIIAATNRDLEDAVDRNVFRQDFYYRINVFPIGLPPLRKRHNDIHLLIDHFVKQHATQLEKTIHQISPLAMNIMMTYNWPGNIRELENCIIRAILLSTDGIIDAHHLPSTMRTPDANRAAGGSSLSDRVLAFEKSIISDALQRCEGKIAAVARELNSTSRIVGHKLRSLGIEYKQYRRKQ